MIGAIYFHHWMLKENWKEHSSGKYYYKDTGSWPPAETATEEELLQKFFGKS